MPTPITDVDVFTSPVERPAGSDPADSASLTPGFQSLANRTRFLYNMIGGGPQSRKRVYGTGSFRAESGTWDITFAGSAHYASPLSDAAVGTFRIDHLPRGCVITAIDLMVGTSASRSGVNRWRAQPYHAQIDFVALTSSTPSIAAEANDGGVLGATKITWSGLGVTIAEGSDLVIRVVAPTGSLGAADVIYGTRITFDDPGPRND